MGVGGLDSCSPSKAVAVKFINFTAISARHSRRMYYHKYIADSIPAMEGCGVEVGCSCPAYLHLDLLTLIASARANQMTRVVCPESTGGIHLSCAQHRLVTFVVCYSNQLMTTCARNQPVTADGSAADGSVSSSPHRSSLTSCG